MSTIKYLIDFKNRRAFCLGDRYYSTLFCGVQRPLTLLTIATDLTECGSYGSPELAQRLLAFCETAGWQIGQRSDNTEYEKGFWGADGFMIVGSVWHEDDVKKCVKKL